MAEARTWLGTPYRHQARTRGVAVDCIGLIGGVALALEISGAQEWAADATLHNYARMPGTNLLTAGCSRFLDHIALTDAVAGDVLLFALEDVPRHFAILSQRGPDRVIHAYASLSARRVVEQTLPIAKARVLRAYRFRGIEA